MQRCRARLQGDDGVYAILYALLVLILVGTAAVVVDLAMLRESRASTRSAADAAVLVAAASLNSVQPNRNDPRGGCERAWAYLKVNLVASAGDLPDGSATCAVFPTTTSAPPSCPLSAAVAEQASPGWTVRLLPCLLFGGLSNAPANRPRQASIRLRLLIRKRVAPG